MRRNNEKRICDWKFIRTRKMIDIKKKITEHYKIPSNTVDGAIMDICRNFKSCLSNLKNKNIKHFNLRYDNNRRLLLIIH
jgi:hypothetical protein